MSFDPQGVGQGVIVKKSYNMSLMSLGCFDTSVPSQGKSRQSLVDIPGVKPVGTIGMWELTSKLTLGGTLGLPNIACRRLIRVVCWTAPPGPDSPEGTAQKDMRKTTPSTPGLGVMRVMGYCQVGLKGVSSRRSGRLAP